jgi:hypothetical protein
MKIIWRLFKLVKYIKGFSNDGGVWREVYRGDTSIGRVLGGITTWGWGSGVFSPCREAEFVVKIANQNPNPL